MEGLSARVESLTEELRVVRTEAERTRLIASALFDQIPSLIQQLQVARTTKAYEDAFNAAEPLVSIRISTFDRAQLLIDRALASALEQTYERIEVVIVGDHCSDDTEKRIRDLADPRVRFMDLPFQAPYPTEPRLRWYAAGAQAKREGSRLSRGAWIAPLDDDDEFLPDHVESLLNKARKDDLELVYGKLLAITDDDPDGYEIGRFPPALGHFGWQGGFYPGALKFFEDEPKSWIIDEIGDWNMCRRMLEAGVRVGWIDQVVTRIYPTGPREPSPA